MGLVRGLLTLPVSGPIRGALWLADKIAETAEGELNDPAAIRRALRALEADLDAGLIDEDAFEAAELTLLQRLKAQGS